MTAVPVPADPTDDRSARQHDELLRVTGSPVPYRASRTAPLVEPGPLRPDRADDAVPPRESDAVHALHRQAVELRGLLKTRGQLHVSDQPTGGFHVQLQLTDVTDAELALLCHVTRGHLVWCRP